MTKDLTEPYTHSGKSECYILIKAAPQFSRKYGETVCCAGIDSYGNWMRLYPVSFDALKKGQRFKRWDHIEFEWEAPKGDKRKESHHIKQDTIKIIGRLKSEKEKQSLLSGSIVESLKKELDLGHSLALLRPKILSLLLLRNPQKN